MRFSGEEFRVEQRNGSLDTHHRRRVTVRWADWRGKQHDMKIGVPVVPIDQLGERFSCMFVCVHVQTGKTNILKLIQRMTVELNGIPLQGNGSQVVIQLLRRCFRFWLHLQQSLQPCHSCSRRCSVMPRCSMARPSLCCTGQDVCKNCLWEKEDRNAFWVSITCRKAWRCCGTTAQSHLSVLPTQGDSGLRLSIIIWATAGDDLAVPTVTRKGAGFPNPEVVSLGRSTKSWRLTQGI